MSSYPRLLSLNITTQEPFLLLSSSSFPFAKRRRWCKTTSDVGAFLMCVDKPRHSMPFSFQHLSIMREAFIHHYSANNGRILHPMADSSVSTLQTQSDEPEQLAKNAKANRQQQQQRQRMKNLGLLISLRNSRDCLPTRVQTPHRRSRMGREKGEETFYWRVANGREDWRGWVERRKKGKSID